MSIVRVAERKRNYVMLQKHCLDETRLSFQSKGLHCYLLSKPDNWEVRIKELTKASTNGRDAVYRMLNELIDLGYVHRIIERDTKGRVLNTVYCVYELPQVPRDDTQKNMTDLANNSEEEKPLIPEKPEVDKIQHPGKPDTANPHTDNPPLIINKDNNKITKEGDAVFLQTDLENIAAAFSKKQITLIEKKLHLAHLPRHLPSAVWREGIIRELRDPQSFKQCCNLLHKLNTIIKLAKAGQWSPELSKAQSVSLSPDLQQYKILTDQLAKYRREKAGWEYVIAHPKSHQDAQYLASSRNEVIRLNNEITKTQQLLAELEQTTQLQKEPHCARI